MLTRQNIKWNTEKAPKKPVNINLAPVLNCLAAHILQRTKQNKTHCCTHSSVRDFTELLKTESKVHTKSIQRLNSCFSSYYVYIKISCLRKQEKIF